jgi:uncharacterized protein involved in exopolysaccharide biosynthesis
MRRTIARLRRRSRRLAAALITALALTAVGYLVAVAHAWAACHDWHVRAYPRSYPSCQASSQSDRPMVMAGAGGLFLLLGVGAAYLWTEEESPGPARRRR